MPELPEVETVRRCLETSLAGDTITDWAVHHDGVVETVGRSGDSLFPARVTGLRRHGKYLFLDLDSPQQLLVHFRMTGSLCFCEPRQALKPHTHVVFNLSSRRRLVFRDPRRFGRVWVYPSGEENSLPMLRKLGPDALNIPQNLFVERLRQHHGRIKSVLLNQTVIAGLGNIYVDEILHQTRVHPERLVDGLARKTLIAMWSNSQEILCRAIEKGGTTVRDYVNSDGQQGGYQNEHRVYGREGQVCLECGHRIHKIRVAQRGTYYCPRCQPNRKPRPVGRTSKVTEK